MREHRGFRPTQKEKVPNENGMINGMIPFIQKAYESLSGADDAGVEAIRKIVKPIYENAGKKFSSDIFYKAAKRCGVLKSPPNLEQ